MRSWDGRRMVALVAASAAGLASGLLGSPLGHAEDAAARPDRCTIVGTPGPDVLVGGPGDDVICGRGGADRLIGGGGDDILRGGGGNDVLVGGSGDDVLVGGPGRDDLRGGPGADVLRARDGARDLLRCGPGRDRAESDPRDRVATDCGPQTLPNRPPTGIVLEPSEVAENQPSGTEVGRLSATDPDPDDVHTFTLVAGEHDTDNDAVTIDDDRLLTAEVLDFETSPELEVRVRVTDAGGATFEQSLVVSVVDEPENTAPVAVDDQYSVLEDGRLDLPVSGPGGPAGNDTDADGDRLTVIAVSDAAGGTVSIVAGTTVRFVPAGDRCGPAGFSYVVSDGRGGQGTARVTIDVTCVDDPPTARDDAATVTEDDPATPVDVLANDSDTDGGPPFAVTAVTQPAHGTVVVTGAGTGLTYEPDADFCGADSFTYTVGGGSVGTVRMTVACVDDAPVAVDDAATVAEDAAATAVDVLANDTDVDGGPMSVASVTQPAHGTVVVTGGGTGLTYQPDAGYCDPIGLLPDTFTYTLDGGSTATVRVFVVCDSPPVAVDDTLTVSEDAAATAVAVLANDTDVDGGPMSVASVTQPAHGTVVVTGGGTGLTYEPAADYCGSDSFTYTLNGSSTATVAVTVTCVDDAPVAVDDTATVLVGAAATAIDVLANDTDVDGGPMSVASVTQPADGAVVVTGGGTGLTYQPDAGYCDPTGLLPDTFTYTLNRGSTATVLVSVACDSPPVAVDDTLTVSEDAAATAVAVLANDTDVDGGPMSVASVTQPAHGTVVVTGGGTGLTYVPTADYCGSDSFTYTLNGGSTATVSVTVTCVDDAPVAVGDTATVSEDAAATAVAVLTNDTDIDGGPKSVASVTQPAHGAVVVTGGGTGLTYEPDADFCGTDTFTYELTPGGSTATVTMTVTCVNDAPVADDKTFNGADAAVGNTVLVVDDDTDGTPTEAGPHKTVAGDLLAGATDVDGPGPLAVVPGTLATNGGGSVVLQADGDFVYTPPAGCSTASDYFDYTVTDGATPVAGTGTGRVTVTISGCVWYVSNNATGNSGTSGAPFDTLAQAQAASSASHTIYVFRGDGTATGYSAGIDLKADQSLVGEVADLTVGAVLLRAGTPGARPTITDDGADVVVLAAGNTVRGIQVDPRGAGGGIAGGAGDVGGTIADVRVVDTGVAGTQPALELDGTSGTFAVSDLVIDTTAATGQGSGSVGVRLNNAGTVGFAAAGTVSISTKGAKGLDVVGTSLGSGSVFDTITVTGSGSGAVSMTTTTGWTTFTDLDLTTTSGAAPAFALDNAGTVTVPSAGSATVSATGGPAVDVVATAGATLAFDVVTSVDSASDGVNLSGLGSGTFTAGGGSSIANAAGVAFDLAGGSGAVTYDGTITDDLGQLVRVQGATGGTKDFNGAITDGGDGDGAGISLTGNAGSTVRFDGGLTISTGSNPAFAATGGGTVAVTDPAGGASNTLQTTTGVALDVVGTTIASDGLTFERVSSNGAPVGVRLSNTGASGGLTVTGAGGTCTNADTSGCTGGRILNGVGGDDAGPTPAGTGIVLNNTVSPSLTRMHLQNHANYAIRGTGVTGFTLATSVVNGANGTNDASPYNESSVRFDDLTGSASVSASHISGGKADNFRVVNSAGSLDRITFSDVVFGADADRPSNDGLLLESAPSAGRLHATITGSTFRSAAGDLLQLTHGGSGTGDLVLTGSTFSNSHPAIAAGGGGVSLFQAGQAGSTTMTVTGNSFRDAVGPGVLVVKSAGTTTQTGVFANNTIGVAGVPNSGSAEGSALKIQQVGQGTSTWSVTGNTIRQYNNHGIEMLAGGGASASAGTFTTTVTGNTIEQPGTTPATIAIPKQGIHYNIGTVPGDTFTACAVIGGVGALANQVHASGADATPATGMDADIRLRQRQSTTIRLPGYGGTATDAAAVQSYLNARSSAGTSSLASTSSPPGGGFVNGTCP